MISAVHDDALKALVADVGSGIVIDAELLEGCPVAAHELDEMDATQAAEVASHIFLTLFETKVSQQAGDRAEPEEGEWSGTVNGFKFEIERDDLGDLVASFCELPPLRS